MAITKQEPSRLRYLKQTAKWIYYADTMLIMLTAFNLYYDDIAEERESKTGQGHAMFPAVLVTLNMVVVIMIWCHFTYPKKTTILVTLATIVGLLIYRALVANFNYLCNIPNMVAIAMGVVWIICDQVHQEKEDSHDGRTSNTPSPATSSTPTASLDSAERGTNKMETTETSKSASTSANTQMPATSV